MIRQLYYDGPGFRHVPPAIATAYSYMASWVPGAFQLAAAASCWNLNGVWDACSIACGPLFLYINPSISPPRASFRFLSPFRVYASPRHPSHHTARAREWHLRRPKPSLPPPPILHTIHSTILPASTVSSLPSTNTHTTDPYDAALSWLFHRSILRKVNYHHSIMAKLGV